MKEELVSFETAKLAKKKGFPKKPLIYRKIGVDVKGNDLIKIYVAQSLLQKWLRDKKKIHVCPDVTITNQWYFTSYDLEEKRCSEFSETHEKFNDVYFDTYEEALEVGLQEGLKLIK